MSRIDDLKWLRETTEESIRETAPEKRAPLIAQMRAIAQEIAELGGDAASERSGLIDFQEALADRQQSASKGARRPARG